MTPSLKCAGAIDALIRDHRSAVEVIYRGTEAGDFLTEFIRVAGPPPFEIKPSGLVVFRDNNGLLAGQFFDGDGCLSFGVSFNDEFFSMLRTRTGSRI